MMYPIVCVIQVLYTSKGKEFQTQVIVSRNKISSSKRVEQENEARMRGMNTVVYQASESHKTMRKKN